MTKQAVDKSQWLQMASWALNSSLMHSSDWLHIGMAVESPPLKTLKSHLNSHLNMVLGNLVQVTLPTSICCSVTEYLTKLEYKIIVTLETYLIC